MPIITPRPPPRKEPSLPSQKKPLTTLFLYIYIYIFFCKKNGGEIKLFFFYVCFLHKRNEKKKYAKRLLIVVLLYVGLFCFLFDSTLPRCFAFGERGSHGGPTFASVGKRARESDLPAAYFSRVIDARPTVLSFFAPHFFVSFVFSIIIFFLLCSLIVFYYPTTVVRECTNERIA